MRLMDRLNDYDELERELKDVRDWNDLANLDDDKIRDLLGEETQEQMQQLSQIAKMLEDAGYIKKNRRGYELTPQGVRKIGEKALTDIFQDLKKDKSASTNSSTRRAGRAHRRHQALRVRRPVPARSAQDGHERGPARRCRLAGQARPARLRGLPHRVHHPLIDRADGRYEPLDVLQRLFPAAKRSRWRSTR